MLSEPNYAEAQKGFVRLRVDVTRNNRLTLRDAIGAPQRGAPYVAFYDGAGALRRDMAILGYDAPRMLQALRRAKGD